MRSVRRTEVVALMAALLGACQAPRPLAVPSTSEGSANAVAPAAASRPAIQRQLLEQRDIPELPGWESRLYLIEVGPGVSAPPHSHPAVGIGFVLEGEFESAFEGAPLTHGSAGESFADLAGTSHTLFRNRSASNRLRFLIAYTIRKGMAAIVSP